MLPTPTPSPQKSPRKSKRAAPTSLPLETQTGPIGAALFETQTGPIGAALFETRTGPIGAVLSETRTGPIGAVLSKTPPLETSMLEKLLAQEHWSRYQRTIFRWVTYGEGHAVVSAVPGSGKTTTCVAVASLIGDDALFLAFNKHVAETLRDRLPAGVRASTLHSLGFGALCRRLGGNLTKNDDKYRVIATQLLLRFGFPERDAVFDETRRSLLELAHFARVTLTDPRSTRALVALADDFEVELSPGVMEMLPLLLDAGMQQASLERIIDYDDMLWLPFMLNARPRMARFVIVDETQDLSSAQLELALSAVKPGGRMLLVGDEHQSIFGFAGAGSDTMQRIMARLDAAFLPLSISYRCPSSHVALAAEVYPGIEARTDAPEGSVERLDPDVLEMHVRHGDMVICRTTAPLISACFRLIRAGIAAKVRGRDIGANLARTVTRISKRRGFRFENTQQHLEDWYEAAVEEAKTRLRDTPQRLALEREGLRDRFKVLEIILLEVRPVSFEAYITAILALFDDGLPSVLLSTVHRAKGLEAERVFILRPELMPHPMASGPDALRQEFNCKYVALTRAKSALFFVAKEKKVEDDGDEQVQEGQGA